MQKETIEVYICIKNRGYLEWVGIGRCGTRFRGKVLSLCTFLYFMLFEPSYSKIKFKKLWETGREELSLESGSLQGAF